MNEILVVIDDRVKEMLLDVSTDENHHTSLLTNTTTTIPRFEHQKIHDIIPNKTDLSIKMRQYDAIVKLIVMQKNWLKSHKKDFGITTDLSVFAKNILELEVIKKKLMITVREVIKDDFKLVDNINGLGIRYLVGILAYAHPHRFSNLHKFLVFCGYKASSKKSKKYNRKVCSIIHMVGKELIIKKDEKYYNLYLKIKEDLRKKNPTYTKGRIDSMTINRISTFLLKEVYSLFRNREER
jgi:hypothetical protein